jgi:four helix bundle protein
MNLSIESLDAYRISVEINHFVAEHTYPQGRAHLKDQGIRAADSLVLNIAEGMGRGRQTKAGRNHFRIARGSLLEVYAVADLLKMGEDLKGKIRVADRLLWGLIR